MRQNTFDGIIPLATSTKQCNTLVKKKNIILFMSTKQSILISSHIVVYTAPFCFNLK